MAHAKVTPRLERIMDQLGKGYRTRYVAALPFQVAAARAADDADDDPLADCLTNETEVMPIFVAPCICKVARIFVNAKQYPTNAGTITVKATKAVIGATDVDLCATIDINNPTDETAIDAVLSTTAGALDLVEGQAVYATIAASVDAVNPKSIGAMICVEYYPKEA